MNITVVGSGYVGLVTGTCLAEMGNQVCCVDINKEIVHQLNQGSVHIFEPGLEEMLKQNLQKKSITFTSSIKEAIEKTEIIFIAVGTPTSEDGSAYLEYVFQAARDIGQNISSEAIIINKSTVPVGTAGKLRDIIQEELRKRKIDVSFDVVSNPEFLKEGDAISDFMKPDRIVVGADNPESIDKMKKLYSSFMLNHECFLAMDIHSAELTKYAANAMLAAKISFINEISNIAERVGADINLVRTGVGSDQRIGYHFIYPGCGYGGSCFPKDVRALAKTALEFGYKAELIEAIEEVNDRQKLVLVEKVVHHLGEDLSNKKICIWGLSFKPGTDDMREAPSIVIMNELTKRGAQLQAYDPQARKQAEKVYLKGNPNITYFEDKYEAVRGADCMLLLTGWKEFRQPDFHAMKNTMKESVIFDGRNQYNKDDMKTIGFKYFQIGYKGS